MISQTLRRATLALALLAFTPFVASAASVTTTVEPWRTTDGNFGFSVIHSASGNPMVIDGDRFYGGGSIQYEVAAPTQSLMGDLSGDVLSLSLGSIALVGGATLNITGGALDFGVANGALIGSIAYELVDGGTSEVGAFYFVNYDYSNGACDANGLCADGEYRLWGNNWNNLLSDKPAGNVTVNGSLATVHRGIDLGGSVKPIPEPSSALLFALGALLVGATSRREV